MKQYLRSVDPEQNRFRWYSMHLQFCLDGSVDLIRSWGRIGQTHGREKIEHFDSEKEAKLAIERILRVRHNHGYQEPQITQTADPPIIQTSHPDNEIPPTFKDKTQPQITQDDPDDEMLEYDKTQPMQLSFLW